MTAQAQATQVLVNIMHDMRDNTRPAHDEIEKTTPLTALIEGQGSVQDFIGVLKASLSYYRPLEQRLMQSADPAIRDFMQPRLKTDLIKRDLARLGAAAEEIDAVADYPIPAADTSENLLGALYVLEGSTLGGKVITKKLQTHYGWDMLQGEHFLNPYGNQVMPRWKEFGAFVQERFETGALDRNAMVKAAQDTFVAYNACLAAVPMPQLTQAATVTAPVEQMHQHPPIKTKGRGWSLKKTFAVIAAGTILGTAAGAGVGGFGGATVRDWLSHRQAEKMAATETMAGKQPASHSDAFVWADAAIGAAVFGAYSLRGMIVTVFGLQGLRAGWTKLTHDKNGNKKCPFHFDR